MKFLIPCHFFFFFSVLWSEIPQSMLQHSKFPIRSVRRLFLVCYFQYRIYRVFFCFFWNVNATKENALTIKHFCYLLVFVRTIFVRGILEIFERWLLLFPFHDGFFVFSIEIQCLLSIWRQCSLELDLMVFFWAQLFVFHVFPPSIYPCAPSYRQKAICDSSWVWFYRYWNR